MFLCGYYQKTCIRKFLLLVLAVIMLVCSYHTYAQSAPTDTSNGVVVNESPCEPVKGTYENYVDALKKRYTTMKLLGGRLCRCSLLSVSCTPCTPERNSKSVKHIKALNVCGSLT